MDSFRRRLSYEEPFNWWGPAWKPPAPRSLSELIEADVVSAEAVALLWLLIDRRYSILVAAGPSGVGKTTFLTAIVDLLPAETRKIYLRGCYEPFDFLSETEPGSSALLVNEISPHLPIYLWGPGVRKALACVRDGYQLFATAHATSLDELIYSLAAYPLRIPLNEVASLGIVVFLDVRIEEGAVRRQVDSIVLLRPEDRGGLAPTTLAFRESRGHPLKLDVTGLDIDRDELTRRAEELRKPKGR